MNSIQSQDPRPQETANGNPSLTVLEAIEKRRTIRHYDPEYRMDEGELRTLLSAAALAPSSYNMQNRHLVAVVDQEVKDQLHAAAYGQNQVRDASLVVVLTGDLQAHRRPERFLRDAPPDLREVLMSSLGPFYGENRVLIREESVRSVGLAGMTLMLAAEELGYNSGPMIGFDPAAVSEAVGLDADHPPLMLITVGKALQPAPPRLGLFDLEEVVSIDRFGRHSLRGKISGGNLSRSGC